VRTGGCGRLEAAGVLTGAGQQRVERSHHLAAGGPGGEPR